MRTTPTIRLYVHFGLLLAMVIFLDDAAVAKKGGNKPPSDGGGSCLSKGVDTDGDGSIDSSTRGLFVHVGEIFNPNPTENAFFGNSVAAAKLSDSAILTAVVSKLPGKVDVFLIDAAGQVTRVDTVVVPGLSDASIAASVELEDVNADSQLDLIVTHRDLQQGWLYLAMAAGPMFSGGNPIELLPVVSSETVQDAGFFGDRSVVLHKERLYVPARTAKVRDRGPRGAVFVCDLSNAGSASPPTQVDCTPLPTPQDFLSSPISDYDVFGSGITLGDVSGDGNPELLVSAQGAGGGKNAGPDRIFAYGLHTETGQFDLSDDLFTLAGAAGFLHAFHVAGSTAFDEVFGISFPDASGKVFVDSTASRSFDPNVYSDFHLGLDPELVHEYGTNTDTGTLAGGENLLLVGGPGDPGGCGGGQNNGFAYFYLFDQDPTQNGGNPSRFSTAQSPISNGADFGWEVAATGTNLVLISERAAPVSGIRQAGKIHVYQYQP